MAFDLVLALRSYLRVFAQTSQNKDWIEHRRSEMKSLAAILEGRIQ